MERTTIMIPDELKERAFKAARHFHISFAELVRLSLETKLAELQGEQARDLLFSDREYYSDFVPRNIAKNHDEYLYGDEG